MNSINKSFLLSIFTVVVVTLVLAMEGAHAKATPRKTAAAAASSAAAMKPSSSFWKAKYGDYEISQEGFPFNFVMPAV